MRIGKLDNDELSRLILSKFKHRRPEALSAPRIGVDCAAVDLSGRIAVLSTDPITSAVKSIGRLTVHINCNDAAAAGAEPVGLLVTLLIPPSATYEEVGLVADELASEAALANVDIIGGHTEVTEAVTRMVTCATVLAKAPEGGMLDPSMIEDGDDIVLTKCAGLEGTAVIAEDHADRLDFLSSDELDEARSFINVISVVREGVYASSHGAHAMHDVTEGGVLGAVSELSEASGRGITLDAAAIPIHPVTKKICSRLGLDPLRLLSSGAMLIACPDGRGLTAGLCGIGVRATVIGKVGGSGARTSDGRAIDPPGADELYRI